MKTKTPQNIGGIKQKQAYRKKNLYDRRIILLREEVWTPAIFIGIAFAMTGK
jgi:hypothetical protein